MHVYADSKSIHGAHASVMDSELCELIGGRIEELANYEKTDMSVFIKIVVLEPSDLLIEINAELGFSLFDRHCDAAESHRDWFELTLVLSDDGFGVVIYVPKRSNLEPQLLSYCSSQLEASPP